MGKLKTIASINQSDYYSMLQQITTENEEWVYTRGRRI